MLAKELGAVAINPAKVGGKDFRKYDLVFNYGCSSNFLAKKVINKPTSVERCINKMSTFYRLAKMGLPVVSFTAHSYEIPKHWKTIVCRKMLDGAQNKGITYVEQGEAIPYAALYTDFYEHKFEFRVVVFQGKVVGRYLKEENKQGEWVLNHLQPTGFKKMDADCTLAAELLDIDYVGFDVLANSQTDYKILEANSGPLLTPEVLDIIKDTIHV
jgi:glutathione synthase/RimK-type ligase-like ATP-grasp enzyme